MGNNGKVNTGGRPGNLPPVQQAPARQSAPVQHSAPHPQTKATGWRPPVQGHIPNQNRSGFGGETVRNTYNNRTTYNNTVVRENRVYQNYQTTSSWGEWPRSWEGREHYDNDGWRNYREHQGFGSRLAGALVEGAVEGLMEGAERSDWYPDYQTNQPTWTPQSYGDYCSGQKSLNLVKQCLWLETKAAHDDARGDFRGARYRESQANEVYAKLSQRPYTELHAAYEELERRPPSANRDWELRALQPLMQAAYQRDSGFDD